MKKIALRKNGKITRIITEMPVGTAVVIPIKKKTPKRYDAEIYVASGDSTEDSYQIFDFASLYEHVEFVSA